MTASLLQSLATDAEFMRRLFDGPPPGPLTSPASRRERFPIEVWCRNGMDDADLWSTHRSLTAAKRSMAHGQRETPEAYWLTCDTRVELPALPGSGAGLMAVRARHDAR